MTTELRIGIDIGGTFTDFVYIDPESKQTESFKLLSTPEDPSESVLAGIRRIVAIVNDRITSSIDVGTLDDIHSLKLEIIHGSTVATNALLEHKGEPSALITTRGFKDVIQIGRQNRTDLYDLFSKTPIPLVPPELRFELEERIDKDGRIINQLNPEDVKPLIQLIKSKGISSVAVCFLFSFLEPSHENLVSDLLRQKGMFVSSSHEILPEYREYERFSTTIINSYVSPVLDRYLTRLESSLEKEKYTTHLRVMQSNGGRINPQEARRKGVHCVLSGPAGGVVGAVHMMQQVPYLSSNRKSNAERLPGDQGDNGMQRVITFDMGGTSTDVSLIDGSPTITRDAQIGGMPLRIPVLDIHTIGAGGGSIADVDVGGALRVGPRSAGADPGPACYGKGILPTVTDANLVLGRLVPEYFLGGDLELCADRAYTALKRLGNQLGLNHFETAAGIIEVANAHMERALRVISVERGHDPRLFTLLSIGGAGGLHANQLARNLGIPYVLIPPLASTFSAYGMLAADVIKDYIQTVMLPGEVKVDRISQLFKPIEARGIIDVKGEGTKQDDISVERHLDMRYRGQSYELTVPFTVDFMNEFHDLHDHTYGYTRRDSPVEIVNLRLRVVGAVIPPEISPENALEEDATQALLEFRDVYIDSSFKKIPVFNAKLLKYRNRMTGPALIVRSDTTILLGINDRASVDEYMNILVEIYTG